MSAALRKLTERRQRYSLLFDRNEYARRALAAGVSPDKVQTIFELSDTAVTQLNHQMKSQRGY